MGRIFLFLILLNGFSLSSQVKIGDNPSAIGINSLLELESSDKVFVLNKMTTNQMNAIQPLQGALVYNTDDKCLFMYQGSQWKSLCDSYNVAVTTSAIAPEKNNTGDIWVNNSNPRELISVWNGSQWILINSNPKSGIGLPTLQTDLNPVAGDIYVNETSGELFTFNGTSWVNNSEKVYTATNAITKTADNSFELGGNLTKVTEINTNATNTLALKGLQESNSVQNSLVVVEQNTGILRKKAITDLSEQKQVVLIAGESQLQFTTPFIITNINKMDVYRNGVRIAFTTVSDNTIEIEPAAICYQGDEIRIVQLN